MLWFCRYRPCQSCDLWQGHFLCYCKTEAWNGGLCWPYNTDCKSLEELLSMPQPVPPALSVVLQWPAVFNSVFNLSLCYDEISSYSAKPRQAFKYLRNLVRLIIPLSCFPVLCGTLAFGFHTPIQLRSTGFCFAYDYITNIFHYFVNWYIHFFDYILYFFDCNSFICAV